jgi:hypothetical protein
MALDRPRSPATGPNPGPVGRTGLRAAAQYWELHWHDDTGEDALGFSLREVADSYEARLRRGGLSPSLDRHNEPDRGADGTP